MTARQMLIGDDARQGRQRGMEPVAESVEFTLGVRGRTESLACDVGGAHGPMPCQA